MTIPTIEDLARTVSIAVWGVDYTPRDPRLQPDERWTYSLRAARAVLDALVPTWAEAWMAAIKDEVGERVLSDTDERLASYYARSMRQRFERKGETA